MKLPQASMPMVAILRRERRAALRWPSARRLSDSAWPSAPALAKRLSRAEASARPDKSSIAPVAKNIPGDCSPLMKSQPTRPSVMHERMIPGVVAPSSGLRPPSPPAGEKELE